MHSIDISVVHTKFVLNKHRKKKKKHFTVSFILLDTITEWNDKIVALKKTTQLLYFKTFIEKINSGNLIM